MYRERLLTSIKTALALTEMTAETVNRVCNVIVTELYNYEVTERCTEIDVSDDSTDKLVKAYAATLLMEGKSKRTVKEYVKAVHRFADFVSKSLVEVTVIDVRTWLASLQQQMTLRSCDNYRSYLSTFYRWLEAEEIIKKNPMAKVKRISYESKVRTAFSDIEIDRIRSACNSLRERAEVELLLSSGLRLSELCSMDTNDISFLDNSIIVKHGKGSKQRKVYMSDICREHLMQYLNSRTDNLPCLFVSRNGNRLSTRAVDNGMVSLGKRANVDNVHPHRFRRTFAVTLLKRGVDIRTIQILMGHASLQTTQEYLQIDDSHIRHEYGKAA